MVFCWYMYTKLKIFIHKSTIQCCTFLVKITEIWNISQIGPRGEKMYLWQEFYSKISFDLENWTCFNVTVHHLPKATLRVKYEPDQAKGRKICSGQVMTDKMDGQVDNFRMTAKQSLKIFLNYLKCQSVYIHH